MIRQGASGKDAELEINLFDATSGAAITGHTFVAGEVLLSLPASVAASEVFGNADETNIIEIGRGRYRLRLTALETATAGMVQLELDTSNGYMPHSVTERIGPVDAAVVSIANDVIGIDCFNSIARSVFGNGYAGTAPVLAAPAPTRTAFTIDLGGVATDQIFEGGLVMVLEGTGSAERWFGTIDTFDGATGAMVLLGDGLPGVPDNTSIVGLFAATSDTKVIRALLPAALVGGRMDSSIGAVQTGAAYALQSAVALMTAQALAATANTVSFKYEGQMGDHAVIDLTAETLVGMTITLHNPANDLTDGSAPQSRRIISGAWDGGTQTYTATVDAWTPTPTGTFGAEGDYQVKLWPAGTGLATSADMATLLADNEAIKGLLHHNSMVDNHVYSGADLISFRLRQFSTAADLAAATRGAPDDDDGEIRRWIGTAEFQSAGKARLFKMAQVLP